jgi:hypothetical protein
MDSYASGGIGASVVIAFGVAYKIYVALNHKRSKCNLCGKKIEVSMDIDETTPTSRKDAEVTKCKEISESKKEVEG